MREEDIDAIEARANAATHGPWNKSSYGFQVLTGDSVHSICHLRCPEERKEQQLPDAEFIAHAREDIPRLIRALRDARREAQLFAEDAYGDDRHRWKSVVRQTPWIKNPFQVEQGE